MDSDTAPTTFDPSAHYAAETDEIHAVDTNDDNAAVAVLSDEIAEGNEADDDAVAFDADEAAQYGLGAFVRSNNDEEEEGQEGEIVDADAIDVEAFGDGGAGGEVDDADNYVGHHHAADNEAEELGDAADAAAEGGADATTVAAEAAEASEVVDEDDGAPTFESPVHPLAISQVDKIVKQSLAEMASVASALANAKKNSSAKAASGGGGASAAAAASSSAEDHQLNIAKDAKIAVHKSVNVFVLMLAAMVEHNRREALAKAAEECRRGAAHGGGGRAAAASGRALAAAQQKYRGVITVKDIEAALEAAGYRHLVPMLNNKRPRD